MKFGNPPQYRGGFSITTITSYFVVELKRNYLYMRFLFLASLIGFVCVIALPLEAQAVEISLRTGMVEAINSITLQSQSTEVRRGGTLPVVIYRIDFSITAHEADLTIPRAVTRGESAASGLEFVIESRDGEVTESGVAVGVLIPEGKTSLGDSYTIKSGTTESFSLLAVFVDTPDSSREDRLRITGMTLGAFLQKAELNPSELEHLHTNYVELVETR